MTGFIIDTLTENKLIYKTDPKGYAQLIIIITLCLIGGIGFLIASTTGLEEITILLGISLTGAGGILLILLKKTTWYLDKDSDLVMITDKYTLLRQVKVKRYKISEIADVYWEKKSYKSQSTHTRTVNYHVFIKFNNRREHFCKCKTQQPVVEITNEIRNFLDLPSIGTLEF